jgi:hypothetical protein
VPRLPESRFHDEVADGTFLSFSGALCASWLLSLVGDFSEGFHEGFYVACERIKLLESMRTVAGLLAIILSYAAWGAFIYRSLWWCP